jgi:putative nucleotidyltransferase with HDIG domain
MEKLAAQAAIAIQNARLFESISRRTDELRRRVHELEIVNEVSERVVTLDLQTAQRSALEHIYKTFRADRCAIALYQPDGHSLTITAIEPPDDPALGVTFEATDDPLLTEAIRLRDPVIWRDNPALLVPGNPLHAYFRARGIQLLLIAPLMVGEKAIGFLSVDPAGQGEFEIEQIKLLDTVANQVATALQNALLYDNQQRLNEELTRAYDNTLLGWAHALELRDKETQGHTLRVTELTIQLARKMGYGNSELVHIRRGALLHDIGKMGIPDAILHKPGSLNDDEWAVMRRHPQYAYEMLSSISYLAPSLEIPRYHHEKWDGSGYPCQLKGEAIPLPARVFAVVDVWDALCSDRPYRSAWPRERVLSHIRAGVGTHFDPRVSESFFELV